MIRVYCSRPSHGANDLVAALRRLGAEALRVQRVSPRWLGALVNWGCELPPPPAGLAVLNPRPLHNKLQELYALREAGIRVPEFLETARLNAIEGGIVGGGDWLGRALHHQEGRDLLHPAAHPAYYVKKLDIEREFRLHVFRGKVIRTGKKVPDGTPNPHPWIRSTSVGWKISYAATWRREMSQRYRAVARAAVAALGYDFGAVDLAVLRSEARPRPFVVLEVNAAPGLSISHTADAYARHIVALDR